MQEHQERQSAPQYKQGENTMMDRRHLILSVGLPLALGIPGVTWAADVAAVRAGMVDRARYYLKASNWAPSAPLLSVDKVYYCNIFVADVASDAGGHTWDMIPGSFGSLNQHDPLAADWENPSFPIKGWRVVFHAGMLKDRMSPTDIFSYRQPGDVISGGGHMGIMSDDTTSQSKLVFSASAKTGAVELNDWSFRLPDQDSFKSAADYNKSAREKASRFTVHRFVG
jgi:hypothetical protein